MNTTITNLRIVLLLMPLLVFPYSACYGQEPASHHLQEAHTEWTSFVQEIRSAHPSLAGFYAMPPLPLDPPDLFLFVPAKARKLSIEKHVWGNRQYYRQTGRDHRVHFSAYNQYVYTKDVDLPSFMPDHFINLEPLWEPGLPFSEMSSKRSERRTGRRDPPPITSSNRMLFPTDERPRYFDCLIVSTDVGTRSSMERMATSRPWNERIPSNNKGFFIPETSLITMAPEARPTPSVAELERRQMLQDRLEQDRLEQRPKVEEILNLYAARATANVTRHTERFMYQQRAAIRRYEASDSQDHGVLATSARAAMVSFDAASVKRAIDAAIEKAMQTFDNSFRESK